MNQLLMVDETHLRQKQGGWIMLEVLFCLALFSLVLYAAQYQSSAQWQITQRANERLKYVENQQKQVTMVKLIGPVSWLDNIHKTPSQTYPDCQQCSNNDLKLWLQASLHYVPQSVISTSKQGGK